MSSQISFELQTQHEGRWRKYRALEAGEQPVTAAEEVLDNGTQAVRVARMAFDPETGHTVCTIVHRAYAAGRREVDPWAEIEPLRTEERCNGIEDFYTDRAREEMRGLLAKYLDDAGITPSELLHHEKHARRLDGVGTFLQGALQKVAIAQVAGTRTPAPARLKELMDISSGVLRRLMADEKAGAPVALVPGQFAELARGLRRKYPDAAEFEYQLGRALAAHLADAEGWLAKLAAVAALFDPALAVDELRVLDSFAADMIGMAGCLKDLLTGTEGRTEAICALIRFYGGQYLPPEAPEGLDRIQALLAHPKAPRARWTLRTRILRELYSRQPLGGGGLLDEAQQIGQISQALAGVPALGRDPEIDEALAWRGGRVNTEENVRAIIVGTALNSERIEAFLKIANALPGQANRTAMFQQIKPFVGPDLVAQLQRKFPGFATLARVCELMRRIDASALLPEHRAELTAALDGHAFKLFATEVAQKRAMDPVDKANALLSLCPLPESQVRALVAQMVSSLTKQPDFFNDFIARYSTQAERVAALTSFRDALVRADLHLAG
ncbi:MAG TPA: hypothetical protein VEH84_18630 [Alphaproteobacteria bacterium]|nr:hypothetical protein [Alphaproteobacteria bacterium]